jgi:hypothetical protein
MLSAYALHELTPDEEATARSLSSRDATGRLSFMPTHHFGEYGDLTGFKFECGATASGACLPVSRRMFYGHTMAECLDGEGEILRTMSRPEENREAMRAFLEATERDCAPALLDCIPDNSDAVTTYGTLQARRAPGRFLCSVF